MAVGRVAAEKSAGRGDDPAADLALAGKQNPAINCLGAGPTMFIAVISPRAFLSLSLPLSLSLSLGAAA